MKKFILKILLWIFILLFIIVSILLGLGYLKYKEAISKISLNDAILEIKNNSNYTNLENISEDYKNAVVAIEDHRFYSHSRNRYFMYNSLYICKFKENVF